MSAEQASELITVLKAVEMDLSAIAGLLFVVAVFVALHLIWKVRWGKRQRGH